MNNKKEEKPWILDRFDDVRILRYEVPGFESLPLDEKILIYYLAQASVAGQDIIYDQNFKYNIEIRDIFHSIVEGYEGDRDEPRWEAFERYAKRVWFSNGIHHHYSGVKFAPEFTPAEFLRILRAYYPHIEADQIAKRLHEIIFDPEVYKYRITHQTGVDIVKESACNYYDGVSQEEAEHYYEQIEAMSDSQISHGLNSQLAKDEAGNIFERRYKLGGMYSDNIEQIIYWLERAMGVANEAQKEQLRLLIEFYRTGDLQTFDEFNIAWVSDNNSNVDFVNGFIEVYGDPLGRKGAWEGLVNFRNEEASRRTEIIAENAQWFEDHSPINPAYRKAEVKGVSAKVITVAMLGGDCYPSTPIGINLPNAEWIRRDYGSKSVTIDNITHAYAEAAKGSGFSEEFFLGAKIQELIAKYGEISDSLHTDLHECLGHGSGQLAEGVSQGALGSYHSVIEECRADLFGLYYVADPKLVELGLLPSTDAAEAQYTKYLTNGALTQLARIELGDDVEQTHMRNRKIISEWILERGAGVAELIKVEGKSYIEVKDCEALRGMFGELLYEIQRIKSEGDFEAAKQIVERYGVKIDRERHAEILERYSALGIEPYNGFVNPTYTPVMEGNEIVDIDISYPISIW
ncbi:MAG: dihydrofolate reductase [Rikenellaceae bacterium]